MNNDLQPEVHSPEQQRRMFASLRFTPALEAGFRKDYENDARISRIVLWLLATLLVAVTPLYDVSLLHAPADFVASSRLLQFGLQIPVMLVAVAITTTPKLRWLSAPAAVVGALAVAGGLMTQRIIGSRVGFEVPHDFPAITFAATLFLARLRLFYFLPWAVLGLAATTVVEVMLNHQSLALYGVFSSWMLLSLAAGGAYLFEYSARQNWYRGRLLEFQASRDSLTDLPNRRHFDSQLRELVRDAMRQGKTVALLLLDIDHFKAYNDHYGHPAGDQCLRRVGVRLRLAMRRPRDFCARVGGEEFAAVWFDSNPRDAIRMAEELRMAVQELRIVPAPGSGDAVTASGGFAFMTRADPADRVEDIANELIMRADTALYGAKRGGRARLIAWHAEGNGSTQQFDVARRVKPAA